VKVGTVGTSGVSCFDTHEDRMDGESCLGGEEQWEKIDKEREKDTIREGKRNYSEKFIHEYQIKHTTKLCSANHYGLRIPTTLNMEKRTRKRSVV
jgi:hypothetical protein